MQVEPRLAALVPHDELAAGRDRRQREHERGEHSSHLLRIAMAHEEAALIVDKELVEIGRDLITDTEALGDACNDRLQRVRPVLALDQDSIGADLPRAADLRVDDCLLPRP
jgi:hypothetical protein